jgi:hypothetical protein
MFLGIFNSLKDISRVLRIVPGVLEIFQEF